MYDISILIPTLQERDSLFQTVLAEVKRQISECPEIKVEVLWDVDNGDKTLGRKRNDLVERCRGKYHCFVDDDDVLSPSYLKTFVPMILSDIDYDCASFVGAYYDVGEFKKLFYHSLSNTSWYETPERYIRTVSPLNLIRTSIVREIQYADIRNTEDHEFSVRLHESGLLKNEFKVDETIPLYHYIDGVKNTRTKWSYTWNGNILDLIRMETLTILVKFPTRNRPQKFLDTLRKYIGMADDTANMKFMITLDRDDTSYDLHEITSEFPSLIISIGESKNKVDAINRDMNRAPPFDIVLLASDDMIPVMQGYDTIIRTKMKELYPDTDGVLWFYDGYQKRTNTLIVMGKKYFDRFGFLYDPLYKSFFCDNEFTEVAEKLGKQAFIDQTIVKHEHPANTGFGSDELYKTNDKYWKEDEYTYNTRNKTDFEFDISVLICTMPSRIEKFTTLHKKITELIAGVDLKIEVLSNDRMDIDVGTKRDNMLQDAKGKYSCFIDDDDDISNTYFKEYETLLKDGNDYDCCSLIGKYYSNGLYINPFYHSTKYTTWHETSRGFFRYINHLNLIKTYISRSVGFKMMSHGEDRDFSNRLYESGRIKTEGTPKDIMYYYFYLDKNAITLKPPSRMPLSFLRRM